ncbi:hypothetical protein COOONC_02741 [Cooperia oncophora]
MLIRREFRRKTLRQTLSPSPPVGILRRSPEIGYSPPFRAISSESKSAAAAAARDYRSDRWTCTYPTPHRRSRSSYELRDRGGRDYSYEDKYLDRDTYVQEKLELDEMYRKRTHQERVGRRDYTPRTTVVPIQRLDGEYRRTHAPRPYHAMRSKSSDYILEKEYSRTDDFATSDTFHRFYDRDGRLLSRDQRRGYDIDIQRDYDRDRYARRDSWDSWRQPRFSKSVERRTEERMEYEEKEKRMNFHAIWRDVIDQQRQPAPGYAADTRRIRDASASLGNLPAIINRKLEETRKLEKERQTANMVIDRTIVAGNRCLAHLPTQKRMTDQRTTVALKRFSYAPDYRTRHYDSSKYGTAEARGASAAAAAVDSSYASDYRRREHRELSPSPGYGRREMSAAFREEVRREPVTNEQVVAVSGKHRCAHCAEELGEAFRKLSRNTNNI